ncbi:Leucine dehydrogenase [Heyndrickxia coagulans]|nr:Leucine dehydrogenase [Heyndrickxia coagulans]
MKSGNRKTMRKWHSFCIFNSEGWPVIPEKAVCRFKKRHRDVRYSRKNAGSAF